MLGDGKDECASVAPSAMPRRLPVLPLSGQAGKTPGLADEAEAAPASQAARPTLPELPLRPVRRLTRPTAATFRRFARAGLPLVVRGGLEDFPAVGRWTPEYLLDRAGALRAKVYVQPEGHIHIDPRTGFQLRELSLADYANEVLAGHTPGHYFRAPVGALPAGLQAELGEPVYCRGARRLRKNLWFSASGTVSRLHFDLPHNLIAQLTGEKRFVLYPFTEYLNLYPFRPWSAVPHLSRVDLGAPDFRRFPRLPLARGFHCDLEPGDLLFMPGRMWHYALSLGPSVSVNYWWPSLGTLPAAVASDAYKRLRGLNI